jgi:tetratricopeptide (TPR) repeat protein
MTDTYQYIDAFFEGTLPESERPAFAQRIETDREFASEVAIYLASRNSARLAATEDKMRYWEKTFGAEGFREAPVSRMDVFRKYWRYAAAACLVVIAGLFWLLQPPPTPAELANTYFEKNLRQLSQTMDGRGDELQTALAAYNKGDFAQTRRLLEPLANSDPKANVDAVKYTGLACLALEDYDCALHWFDELAGQDYLFANPGNFYKAITLLKRNKGDDIATAKALLQEVVESEQVGYREAKEWLKKF